MAIGPLLPEVKEKLPWLFDELGFILIWHDYGYKSVGNSLVELKSDSLRLRFIRDMGKVFAEVASLAEPEDWHDLSWVLEAICGEPAAMFTGTGDLESVASLVRQNLGALIEGLGPRLSQTKQELQRRYDLRVSAPVRRPDLQTQLKLRWRRTRRIVLRLPSGGVLPVALILIITTLIWLAAR
jgi:hypothetical protein